MPDFTSLRPYQREALDAVRASYDAGQRRMLLVAPTGAGKTILFSHLAQWLPIAADGLVIILAHRDELVEQAREKYSRVNPGVFVGVEKGSSYASPLDRVIVASVQSLHARRLEALLARCGRPALIVTDEAHHATSAAYQAIYAACGVTKAGQIVHVGVTATPQRADKVGLQSTYDSVAYAIEIGDLIDKRFLVPITGYRVGTETSLDRVRTTAGELNAKDLADAVDTHERNAAIVGAYAEIAPHKKALVFAASVEHSKALCDAFEHGGFRAAHVDGATEIRERRRILADFALGKYDVLCNCAVLTEGYDEPSIEVVILGRPTKSPVLLAQMVGRGTRLHPGKERLIVIDMVDVSKRHTIVTLPTLLGLPHNFDLNGRDLRATEKQFKQLAEESPDAVRFVSDAAELDAALQLSARDRAEQLIRNLIAHARKTQSYVEVDMLAPLPLAQEVLDDSTMTWMPAGDDQHRIRVGNDVVTVVGDLVGKHTVTITRTIEDRHLEKTLGTFDDRHTGFAIAEDWIRRNAGDQATFYDREAAWRRSSPTEKQLIALERFRVRGADKLSRGQASALLSTLIDGMSRKRSAAVAS